MFDSEFQRRLQNVRLLAMDVDGVLTDGTIAWGARGADGEGGLWELKTFHAQDGLGLGLARAAGLEVAWVTGRVSAIVERRAAELEVRHVAQWARNKRVALGEIAARLGLERAEVLYVGDDLNDLPAFEAAGVRVAVANAVEEIRRRADWTTRASGGHGAVREVVEGVLRAQDRYEEAVQAFLARLEQQHGRPPGAEPSRQ